MRIDSAQLAAFAAVLREGSFEAASRHLNVTPSAVSQRIRLLEERLGQVLINRKSPSQPTRAGETLARLAMQVEILESEALRELGASHPDADEAVRLPIVVNADSLACWFFSTLDVLPAQPAIRFDIRVEDQDHSASLLRDGSVMAAITAEPKPVQGCRVETLGVMRYLPLASPGFIARHFAAAVDSASLALAPVLIFNDKDALQQRFIHSIAPGEMPPRRHYIPSAAGFAEAARRGLGWGMIPEMMAREALATGELAEIIPGRWLDIPLYWQHWRIESTALAALTRAVRHTAALHLRPG
ncbi:LysR family transcriptional regulator ArgP [Paludibacterium yongneupense]|uniref:LysR family transcriptional regulator ArgP n=1 Tax=Paludibacterium yongneupense TaxID=400061 RepID=UPI0004065875|nr:LysR family transcriptional regulator ArgP [Paludibacterium yongneupense]